MEKVKVLTAKLGFDIHSRGVTVVNRLLRDTGMEVIYLGLFNTPDDIISAVVEEDADVLGLSFLSGEHLVFTPTIVEKMKTNGLEDVLLIAGGTIPVEDIPPMEKMGMNMVFRAGTLSNRFVDFINENVGQK
ncbi:MAG TPA: methylmalonyl-CoA mutase [Desulfobacteraceae bacterium]|nr:methylmalonyl-CoA mutase [Desulfobacteraceae bacterium]